MLKAVDELEASIEEHSRLKGMDVLAKASFGTFTYSAVGPHCSPPP